MKHLKPLTSLRFFAAFVVVLCHVRYTHEHQLPAWAFNFARNGFVGVNLFFVLSGFVIAYNYGERFAAKSTTFGKFMLARFARIWPAFVTALALAFPFYVLQSKEVLAKFPLMLPAHLLLIHNWFPNLGASWLSPSWTIGTEWGFYLMFPLFAVAVFRMREKSLWTLLIVSALLTFVAPALYHSGMFSGVAGKTAAGDVIGEDFWGRVLRWYSIFRLPEFLVGVSVCRLFMLQSEETKKTWSRAMGPIAGLSLILILGLMAWDPLPLMYMNQAILTIPFAVLIWYFAYDRGIVAKWMSAPWLLLLGEASYSLYLIHMVVKQVGFRAARHFFGIPSESIPLTIAVIIGSILTSVVIFLLIERPSRRWIVSRFGGKQPPIPPNASGGQMQEPEEPQVEPVPVAP